MIGGTVLISEVLRRKGRDVLTVSPTTSVRDLLAQLAEHDVGALLVSPDGVTLAGIVSERDVVRRLTGARPDLLDQPVEQIMTTSLRTCEPGSTVDEIMGLMTEHRVRHVPVVDGGRLVGVVSIGDVVKQRLDELQSERDQLTAYISS